MRRKKRVILGLVGTVLDAGPGPARWEKWRPTVSLCQHDDLVVDRFELLYQRPATKLTEQICDDITSVSPETEVRKTLVDFRDPWDFEEVYAALHQFARDYKFDTEREEYLVHITTGTHVAQICLFLLTEARYFPAQLVQTSPPKERDLKSPGHLRIIDLDLSRYDRIATRFKRETEESLTFLKSGIVTRNKDFNRLIENIERVAIRSREPMLLMGPTGAGKSQLARRIFELKKSRHQITGGFVEVNCATIRGDAAMSALFGHVKGSFTGAMQDRKGLLVAADGGLLFLDEIGELGLDEQAMLLRAVEEKRFLPVGSDREVRSDFQLIAGTNRELASDVRSGKFREDLLARINLWTFCLPPLARRREDIEPNLDYELAQFSRASGRNFTFNKEARARFVTFAQSPEALWSGNFRDLNAAVKRMATLSGNDRIGVDCVEEEIERLRAAWSPSPITECLSPSIEALLDAETFEKIDRFDRVQLEDVLAICLKSSSLAEAGRILFANSRAQKKIVNDSDRLRKYLHSWDITWERIRMARNSHPVAR
ncbi:MAG TPA: RNA repair transcriptional activator RtcR [Candidatus Kapabacteria bacterium]|nr:RNA repair transcriptional activator RtcR [Candidatus Kapabacteria bacterium]